MTGYAVILKHDNIILTQEELIALDDKILAREKGVEGNDIIDELIAEHKQERKSARKPIKREIRAVKKCSKISGRILATYQSITLAAEVALGDKKFKTGICNAAAGRAKSYKGFVWEYA